MKPSAISENIFNVSTLSNVISFKTCGPKIRPPIRYPVTEGSLTYFTSRAKSRPVKKMMDTCTNILDKTIPLSYILKLPPSIKSTGIVNMIPESGLLKSPKTACTAARANNT